MTAQRLAPGLSSKLLALTILFVLLAAVLIYVPSIASYRNAWLTERIAQARTAALILERTPADTLPPALMEDMLSGMGTSMIALRSGNARRLLAISAMPPMVDFEIDLRLRDMPRAIASTFDILFFGAARAIRVVGPAPGGGEFVEIVIPEQPLRKALIRFSRNILVLALLLSGMTALLVFAALDGLIVRPVKRLAQAVTAFRADPANARSLIRPTPRGDEIGTLERALSEMQAALQQELRQRERLANLGLAVAKINHDLRNMLATAQLVADRIGAVRDPNVQRFVPRLLDALDRAIAFCQSTLGYGRAEEQPPEIRPVDLAGLVEETAALLMLAAEGRPALRAAIPPGVTVAADPGHLGRVLTNLLRNAVTALRDGETAREAVITITARVAGDLVVLEIRDTGPGIPERIRGRLFQAFSGTAQAGGTGLGLAIAAELVRGMGGDIALAETGPAGTAFHVTLPRG
ncbi:sensor histidine kinase [Rhabdaerophilum calidifontis]|uniref:sensor histidine kinase n=1 Tax=Rhabdaerophilum calidifontis TaxID=2604328 RepID=UPI00123C6537|nr:HAMP domain-containing sensor histidine kinase [Rhabdaerophilum calidifontis]